MRHILAGLVLLLPAPALAGGPCDFPAFGNTRLADPIAIHAAPAAGSPVVGLAPHGETGTEFEGESAYFKVVAMQDGWARVEDGQSADYETALPDGWVDSALLTLFAQTELAFVAPDPASNPVWQAMEMEDGVAAEVVLDCSGEWARIRFADYHRQGDERIIAGFLTGWVRGICGSQRTTCDGLVGDRP